MAPPPGGTSGGTANASFYNPRYGVSGSTTQNANAYSRWGSSTISGPNQTVNTASGSNARGSAGAISSSTGAAAAGVHTTAGNNAAVARTASGNVYAGADGNAYKHTDSGWSKWDSGSWQPVQQPENSGARTEANAGARTPTAATGTRQTLGASNYQQLEQDHAARFQGGWSGREAAGRDLLPAAAGSGGKQRAPPFQRHWSLACGAAGTMAGLRAISMNSCWDWRAGDHCGEPHKILVDNSNPRSEPSPTDRPPLPLRRCQQ